MAYNNPFFYNRDSSIKNSYGYVTDLSYFKPVYGSSVSYSSRLNYLQTVNNELKILPSSENNLTVRFNLKFLLSEEDTGKLLKTIEIAGGYKYLKFIDPSNLYADMVGLVEDYSVSRSSNNLNDVEVSVSSYIKSPFFKWRTSSYYSVSKQDTDFYLNYSTKSYSKYDFVYIDPTITDSKSSNIKDAANYTDNKIDNFWFAKNNVNASTPFSLSNWSKDFLYEPKLPFAIRNKFDFYQVDYRNSFIQNIKHKENSNSLKDFSMKFENLTDSECRSMLFFLEKKIGYRRFIFNFPILFKSEKVFICPKWNHLFKYKNCHDIDVSFVEDPNPNIYIDKNNNYFLL